MIVGWNIFFVDIQNGQLWANHWLIEERNKFTSPIGRWQHLHDSLGPGAKAVYVRALSHQIWSYCLETSVHIFNLNKTKLCKLASSVSQWRVRGRWALNNKYYGKVAGIMIVIVVTIIIVVAVVDDVVVGIQRHSNFLNVKK